MSMAFGLELRVPFLDWRLVELSFVMPPSCFFKNGHSKAVLRAAMWDLLPDSVRLAPKRSVVTPQSKWFSGALREGIVNVIESSELFGRGYLNRARARERFDQFCQTENPSNSFFIWQWLNLDLWFREFNVS